MKKKILIVEDEQTLSNALSDSFSKIDYEIEVAYDGEDALAKLKIFKPDLILLDLILPKMDGFTLLSKIKEHGKPEHLSIIVLTNLSDVAEKCRELGASACLVKADESIDNILQVVKNKLG